MTGVRVISPLVVSAVVSRGPAASARPPERRAQP